MEIPQDADYKDFHPLPTYLDLITRAGWEYIEAYSVVEGDEGDAYFVHKKTGQIIFIDAGKHSTIDEMAEEAVCHLTRKFHR